MDYKRKKCPMGKTMKTKKKGKTRPTKRTY